MSYSKDDEPQCLWYFVEGGGGYYRRGLDNFYDFNSRQEFLDSFAWSYFSATGSFLSDYTTRWTPPRSYD